ncbi:MAG: cell division protein SepF [Peptococcaceae bacterium]|jgi:cell division inhibitor SepF|nr:cell division protein SepF [Peptococcaceae bacterium]
MVKLFDKIIGMTGLWENEEDDEELLDEEEEEESYEPEREDKRGRRNAQVLKIHTQKQVKVVVVEPACFEEAQGIADQIRSHRAMVVNLENIDRNLAKRIVDFVSGATYALGGNMQKVGAGIFLFVPTNVELFADAKEDAKDRMFFWQTK